MANKKTIIIGLAFIVTGAVIILSNLGLLSYDFRRIVISWQMLCIVIGLLALINKNKKAAAVLITVGAFFLLPRIPVLGLARDFTRNFWPFMLVVIGVLILIARDGRPSIKARVEFMGDPMDSYSDDGYIRQSFYFNGYDQSFLGPVFKGGTIKVGFGGTNLDLRRTNLPEDRDAVLNIKGFCGGATILVPEDWQVVVCSASSFLGGASDSRPKNGVRNSTRKLILNVECVFGGVEIK